MTIDIERIRKSDNYFMKKNMSKRKKIYIAGAGGMLGEAFYRVFGDDYELKCTDIDVNDKWISYLDFRSFKA